MHLFLFYLIVPQSEPVKFKETIVLASGISGAIVVVIVVVVLIWCRNRLRREMKTAAPSAPRKKIIITVQVGNGRGGGRSFQHDSLGNIFLSFTTFIAPQASTSTFYTNTYGNPT